MSDMCLLESGGRRRENGAETGKWEEERKRGKEDESDIGRGVRTEERRER